MDMKEIIARVPDYTCFMTVDELDQSTQKLASEYPDRVQVRCVGHSRAGHPIQLIKIGHGSKNALVFACPHPERAYRVPDGGLSYQRDWRPTRNWKKSWTIPGISSRCIRISTAAV